MTPRPPIVALPSTVSAEDAAATFRETGLSRIPIFGENHDDIVGILYVKDLFARMTEAKDLDAVSPAQARPAGLLRPRDQERLRAARGVARTSAARSRSCSTSTAAWPAWSRSRTCSRSSSARSTTSTTSRPPPIRSVPLGDSRYEVDATLPLESLNERLGLHLPTDGEFLTVGGLAFHALGRVPEPGETFRADGVQFTVVEVNDHRIRRLRIELADSQPVETRS